MPLVIIIIKNNGEYLAEIFNNKYPKTLWKTFYSFLFNSL